MKYLFFVVFLLLYLRGVATDKYFDAVLGNDGNSGTFASPYKTLAKLNSIFSTLNPGDHCYFKRDQTFYGSITVSKSGTSLAPIVLDSYGSGANPIITSLVSIVGFTETSPGSHIWVSAANSSLLSTVNMVLQNSYLLPLGRYPNLSAANKGYLTITSATSTSITCASLLNTPNFSGAQICVRVEQFTTNVRTVSTHVGTLVNLSSPMSGTPNAGMGLFFQNSLLTLDQQGEWYYNPATKRIYIYSLTMPTGIEATSLETLVSATSISNVQVRNINVIGANTNGFLLTGGSNFDVQGCTVKYNLEGFNTLNTTGLIIRNNSILNSLSQGIDGTNAANSKIRLNIIDSIDQIQGMGLNGTGYGIFTKGTSNIDSNRLTHIGYSAISFDGDNQTASYNFIDTYCNIMNDGAGIYHHPSANIRTNMRVFNNIVINGVGATEGGANASLTQAEAFYSDRGSPNLNVMYNTFANAEAVLLNFGTKNTNFSNNTLFNLKYGLWVNMRSGDITNNDTIRSNKLSALTGSQLTMRYAGTPTEINAIGKIDSNVYARPIDDNLTIKNGNTSSSLAMLKTAYPLYNISSAKSPRTITNTNQFILFYNDTFVAKDTTLSGSWVDLSNAGYSGTITLQPFTSVILISIGSLTVPVITWANPVAITYGAALSSTQYSHTANVTGTFVDNYASGTVLNGGPYTLSTIFTPTNQTLYSTATKTVPLTVNKASATLAFSGATLTQTYTGLPLAPTVNTTPTGLTGVNILYNGVGQTPTNAGSKIVTAGLTNINYSASPITNTFTISKATANITVTGSLNQTADGTQKPVTAITNPVGLTLTKTYNGSSTAPSAVGSYQVIINVVDNNYQATPDTVTLVISANTDAINITNLQQTYIGFNLPVTVTTIPAAQGYSITYNGSPTVAIAAGTYTVIATRNDLSGADTATLVVSKANPVITWSQPSPISLGTELTSVQLSASANVAGSFSYTPTFGNVPSAGTQTLSTIFTPTDTNNYNSISKSVVISVHGNSNSSETYYIRNGHIIYINTP